MKGIAIVTMLLLTDVSAQARGVKAPRIGSVDVCMHELGDMATTSVAQSVAWGMFQEIGVTLKFHRTHSCPPDGIRVLSTSDTPAALLPGALALAQPYEGIHLRIFLDRVGNTVPGPVAPYLLAHVLAHEIAHLLEGVDRHSEYGLMKAKWEKDELVQMRAKHLAFTENDIRFIRAGLAARRRAAEEARAD
jgi:hypothetical protein